MKRFTLSSLIICALLAPLALVRTDAQVGVPIAASPYANVPANYTGWYRVAGTGTNAATAIQAHLDAAYSEYDSVADEYTYLDSTAGVVKLPPGKKIYIAPTGTDPILVVPQGVTLDLNGSTLFVDAPATATNQWCAIVQKHGSRVTNGRIFAISGVVWPGYASADYRLAYDAIRIFESDGDAKVDHMEIQGFRGAAIRVIGSWNTTIKDNRFRSCSYGVVLSKLGDAFTATAYARRRSSTDDRCTSTYIQRNRFTNINSIGLLAGVSGDAATHINTDDFAGHTTMLSITDNYFENISSFAIRCLASWVEGSKNTYENCGNVNGVIEFSVCQGPELIGDHYIRTGVAAPLTRHLDTVINDTVSPNPAAFVRASQCGVVIIGSLKYNIAQSVTMTLCRTATSTGLVAWGGRQTGTYAFTGTDGDITTAPVFDGLYLSGTYDGPHLVVGTVHHWNNAGTPTWKDGVPSSISDGAAY